MQGIITKYHSEKGYGFIYSKEYEEHIFVHILNVTNASTLSQGQSVSFDIEKTKKGLSAIAVVAGKKQLSSYLLFGIISLFITIFIFTYLYFNSLLNPIIIYLVALNSTTFLLYGYDKFISSREGLRIPEWNLHLLAILGGSPLALASQKIFRHKTIKSSFQLIYWFIVFVQIGVVIAFKG